ncbi:MAG: AraC family transcriptional regulator [Aquimarina sp.]|nr:AraC family transcriptional regulator [Aquimarina sp.]
MQEINIENTNRRAMIEQFCSFLEGDIVHQQGESILTFNNTMGKGKITAIDFDWGVSIIDYDVNFNQDTKIVFSYQGEDSIEFIFLTDGCFDIFEEITKDSYHVEKYQNTIVSTQKNKRNNSYLFPGKAKTKANFIRIIRDEYLKKKNSKLLLLNNTLNSIFAENAKDFDGVHLGNYSLKIADELRKFQENTDQGIIRMLALEGQINLVLSMQMAEYEISKNLTHKPDSFSSKELQKIHELSKYIIDNISEPLTVGILSDKSGIRPRKLQLGFKIIYGKSVNEYVRHLKLEVARDHIKESDLSISEIVYNIGYKSRSYFSRIFYERYGILPTEYRNDPKVKI